MTFTSPFFIQCNNAQWWYSFGCVLRRRRIAKKMSLQKMSERIHISVHTLCNFENGKLQPRSRNIERLAAFYGLTVRELILEAQQFYESSFVHRQSP